MKTKKKQKIMFVKSGGTSVNGISGRVSIAKKWLDFLEITPEERNITIELNEEKKEIIIKKDSSQNN